MLINKVFRFRLQPTGEQTKLLYQHAGTRRWIWNWGLKRKQEYYEQHRKTMPFAELSREFTALRKSEQEPWLRQVYSLSARQALNDLEKAYSGFFQKVTKFPNFKSKNKDEPRFRFADEIKVVGNRIVLPGIGSVKMVKHREIEGEIRSATVKCNPSKKWYVSILTRFEIPDAVVPVTPERAVGVDLGLKDFTTLSTGEKTPAPQFYRKMQRKRNKANKAFSRTKKGSKNREKARKKLARIDAKIANQRSDFIHKMTHDLVEKYDCICLEDLNVAGMAKSKLAKSIMDAGFGEFRRQVQYKTEWSRKTCRVVDRWFASSKTCGNCGQKNDGLTLKERTWKCEGCGAVHDRDLNAARNIKEEGLKQTGGEARRQSKRLWKPRKTGKDVGGG